LAAGMDGVVTAGSMVAAGVTTRTK